MDVDRAAPYIRIVSTDAGTQVSGDSVEHLGHTIALDTARPPDGVFAHWEWDGTTLTARNDRLGFYPLYYYQDTTGIALSPSIPRLLQLGADDRLDYKGLAVFLRLGYFIAEDTPFAHIRALPPNAQLRWHAGHLEIAHAMPKPTEQTLSRDQAIDAYIDLFRQAIARRPPLGPTAVPLSGGRDSRHILFELYRQGHRPECISAAIIPPYAVDEGQLAKQIADRLGLRHRTAPQASSRVQLDLAKNNLTGFCTDEHEWYLPVAEQLSRTFTTVYDGIGGDVLSASRSLTPESLKRYRTTAPATLAEQLLLRENTLAHILPRAIYRACHRGLAVEHLANELARHQTGLNPVASFQLFNRTRREIALAPYGLLRNVPRVYSPFLDRDLYDFLAGLPPEMLFERRFHTDTLHRAYPEYADIPFAQAQHTKNRPALRRPSTHWS
ncbi:asparagine synthetase B family protein [Alkalilimnicola ehrlichii]|uniref:asparagine synthase (glutamine-hydrolyzing) n=1 Tax=Alkalilimnicola ehrlichii TaxID=351052 RepID=A0A3E0WMZ4_9GAMM|nr:asparagine synthetase B family protein [Alkalilimnicola ehrlichii]RFA33427.1 hypothetical protein CAL65_17350 [Alkalilimnicola ehrlichii]